MVDATVVNIIKEYKHFIQENNFQAFFEALKDEGYNAYTLSNVSDFLYTECEVDFLKYIDFIPKCSFTKYNGSSFKVPKHIEEIQYGAFKESVIESIELPDTLVNIQASAFSKSNLKSIEIPDSVTNLGSFAFWNCKNLESVKLPNSIKIIKQGTFMGCKGLKSFTVPDSVTDIRVNAFSYCNLQELIIPESVEYMESIVVTKTPKVVKVKEGSYADKYFQHYKKDKDLKKDFIRYY